MPRQKPFSSVSVPTTSQQNSLLLRLPAELRNMIYEIHFSYCRVEISRRSQLPPYGRSRPNDLLLACRQIHQEAIQLYYIHTPFCFEAQAFYRLPEWVNKIGPARAALIRHVNFEARTCKWWFSLSYPDSVALTHVQELELIVNRYKRKARGLNSELNLKISLEDTGFCTSTPVALARAIFNITVYDGRYRWWVLEPPEQLRQRFRYILSL